MFPLVSGQGLEHRHERCRRQSWPGLQEKEATAFPNLYLETNPLYGPLVGLVYLCST